MPTRSSKKLCIVLILVCICLFFSGCDASDIMNVFPEFFARLLEQLAIVCLGLMKYLYNLIGEHLIPLLPVTFFRSNLSVFYSFSAGVGVLIAVMLTIVSIQSYTFFGNNIFSPGNAILRLFIAVMLILFIPMVFGWFCYFFELVAFGYFHIYPAGGDFDIISQIANFGDFVSKTANDPKLSNLAISVGTNDQIILRDVTALIKILIAVAGIFFMIKILLLKGAQLVGLMISFILAPFAACGVANRSLQSWFTNWLRQLAVLLLYSTIWAICLKLLVVVCNIPSLVSGTTYNKSMEFLTPFMLIGTLAIMTHVDSYAESILAGAGNVAGAVGASGGAMGMVIRSPAVRAGASKAKGLAMQGLATVGKVAAGVSTGGVATAAGAVATAGNALMQFRSVQRGYSNAKSAGGNLNKYLNTHQKYSMNKGKVAVDGVKGTVKNISNNITSGRRAIGLTRQIPGQSGISNVPTKDRNRDKKGKT